MRKVLAAWSLTVLVQTGAAVSGPGAVAAPADTRAVLDYLERNDFGAARVAASGARDPLLRAYVEWRTLRDGPQQSFGTYGDFLQRHPTWPDATRLQARAEAIIEGGVGPEAVIRFFKGRTPRTENGRMALLDALYLAGGGPEAQALVRAIWVEDDLSAGEEEEFLSRHARRLGSPDHEARLDRLLWDGRIGDAIRMLPRVSADAQAVAEARIALQTNTRGVDAALARVPAQVVADPGLAYDRIRWHKKRGNQGAIEAILLQQVLAAPAKPGPWWSERAGAARDAMDLGDYGRAYRIASAHGLTEGTEFAEAEWLSGWLALRFLNDPSRALRHFERFSEKVATPISRARGAYWAGRAMAAAGDRAGAALWFGRAATHGTAFYGQLAAGELGQRVGFAAAAMNPPDERARAAFRRDEVARMAEELCAVGAGGEAAPFLRQLGAAAGSDSAGLELVYDLARRCARPDLVVVVAKAAVMNGAEALPTFPVPDVASMLSPSVGRASPAAILAVARQESQFDPKAVSRAGARGLMQLMPTTGREVARRLGLPFDLEALNDDPDFNVQLGSWYLGRQLDRYGGALALAAAAYNAGAGRVDEWLSRYGDPRGRSVHVLVDWIELIPFSETRNYVQRVLEGETVYSTLLAQGGARLVPLAGARQGTAAVRRVDDRS